MTTSLLSLFQTRSLTPEEQRAAEEAARGCLACGGIFMFIVFALIALNVVLLIWVARDAKNRGMDGAVLWMLLVLFTGFIGLIIYLLSRPQGQLKRCPSCPNSRLEVSAKCPHCGNA